MLSTIPGVDMKEGIRRTGNSTALYLLFLKRFPDDPSFAALRSALEEERLSDAFRCAHTLKGLTAQLGITALFLPANNLCDLLRSGDMQTLPQAKELLNAMTPLYKTIVHDIASLP